MKAGVVCRRVSLNLGDISREPAMQPYELLIRSALLRKRISYFGESAGIMLERDIVGLADLAERELEGSRIFHSNMAIVRSRARLQSAMPALMCFENAVCYYAERRD
jgi:hypothetical protein